MTAGRRYISSARFAFERDAPFTADIIRVFFSVRNSRSPAASFTEPGFVNQRRHALASFPTSFYQDGASRALRTIGCAKLESPQPQRFLPLSTSSPAILERSSFYRFQRRTFTYISFWIDRRKSIFRRSSRKPRVLDPTSDVVS